MFLKVLCLIRVQEKTYYALKIDKNRSGDKNKIPVLEVDLDKNIWIEVGHLIKAS